MKSIKKLMLLAGLVFVSSNLFAQGTYDINGASDSTNTQSPCDNLTTLCLSPESPGQNSMADIFVWISGANFSSGPVNVSVSWGDGSSSTYTGQMTAAGVQFSLNGAVEHHYTNNAQFVIVVTITNPTFNSSVSHTLLYNYVACSTNIYAYATSNCASSNANLNNFPLEFTDANNQSVIVYINNGNGISNQLMNGIYSVTVPQWWLDNNGLQLTSFGPPTASITAGGAYTFQATLACDSVSNINCLSGSVFCDANSNGVLNAGETIISNAPIILNSGNQSTTIYSNANGFYTTNYVANANGNGVSTIMIDPNWLSQNGYTGQTMFTILDSLCDNGGTIFNIPLNCDSVQTYTECVGGWIFCDENNNGILDPNESGFANAPVQIYGAGSNNSVTVYTNANGSFYYSGASLGGAAVVSINPNWLAQNGYYGTGNYVYTVITDCDNGTPVYFPINCDSLQAPCADLWTSVEPWIGYYQNQVNYVKLKWGNNGPASAQSYTLTLNYPAGVTPVLSSIANSNYVISGNSISWTISSASTYFTFNDVISFNVPGGLVNGMVHVYTSTITANGNNQDCNLSNNSGILDMILGNSYDPNDKTVNESAIISPDVQDELTYRIRFQNTGTAPAQDIYVLDTLSTNLDWSTFELLDATHYIQVIDLGNGIMKFNFPNIWLPDSATDYDASQGSFTYRIKENEGNGIGSEIENTAYIYFDWNPAIVTNTTYNQNNILSLEKVTMVDASVYPNPVKGQLYINSEKSVTEVKVYDLTGNLVKEKLESDVQYINMSELNTGVYLVQIKIGERLVTKRLVKQ